MFVGRFLHIVERVLCVIFLTVYANTTEHREISKTQRANHLIKCIPSRFIFSFDWRKTIVLFLLHFFFSFIHSPIWIENSLVHRPKKCQNCMQQRMCFAWSKMKNWQRRKKKVGGKIERNCIDVCQMKMLSSGNSWMNLGSERTREIKKKRWKWNNIAGEWHRIICIVCSVRARKREYEKLSATTKSSQKE